MDDVKELISNYLKNWLERNSLSVEFEVSLVENQDFGDFSTNIAMVSAKEILNQVQDDNGKEKCYNKFV